MKKLYTLFVFQFLFKVFHFFYFLRNIPDSIESKTTIYKGDYQVVGSFLVLFFALYFLKKQGKFAYYFLMAVSIIYAGSVFTYGTYFYLAGLFDFSYIVYCVTFFVLNLLIILELIKKDVKGSFIQPQ